MKKRVLIIAAHPDDETIWMGGMILKNINRWDLEIISLCRKDDKDRAPKFRKVCRLLNAKCFMSDLDDEKLGYISTDEVIKRLRKFSNKKYDYIFTHGKNGEYGHIRHTLVNKAVREMLNKKMLLCSELFFFSYIKKGKFCYADKSADTFIKLNKTHLKKKQELIHNVYGFEKKSFEYICCKDKESFNKEMIKI